ncbi:MAG TPA: hypothetical protein VGI06_09485 [Acidimicrobiales bacterium]
MASDGNRGPQVDRRRFLAAGASVALAGAVAACSGGGSGGSGAPFTLLPDTFDFISGTDQRVAMALADRSGNPITPTAPVTLQIAPVGRPLGPALATTMHDDGIPPYLLTSFRFPAPGSYLIRATYRGRHSDFTTPVVAPAGTPIPIVGRPLISVATPTAATPLGVKPVCTSQPQCPFHAVSLDQALAEHRTIALQFATPALCQSRLCGPVLQNLVAVHQPFADRVTFIHCEIYTDLSGQQVTPPVTAYHLQHEPLLFLAGPDGVVRERIDNGYDRVEGADALRRLTSV